MSSLTYETLFCEHNGLASGVKLKLSNTTIQFKYDDTGKSGHFEPSAIEATEWLYRARGYCLLFKLISGKRHYFDGFSENEFEKLKDYLNTNYQQQLKSVDPALKGSNVGKAHFDGQFMEFKVDNKRAMDINLKDIVHVTKSKNELVLQFQTNDEAMSVYEMRFGVNNDDLLDDMYEKIMKHANVLEASGESLVVLDDMHCLQPRGRYEIKVYEEFIHMRGKTYDYSVSRDNFVRFYLLPHPDERQLFFVMQINPPITHGQTRYYFIVLLFDNEQHIDIELNADLAHLQEKYNISQTIMSGATYEIVTKLFKAIYAQKLTIPTKFQSRNKSKAITCSYKTTNGFLYPLDKGFIFVPKPTISIRSEEIAVVNLSRASIMQRNFDFDIETKNGVIHTFSGVDKSEYSGLLEYVKSKSYNLSSAGADMSRPTAGDDWSGSEESHDEYMERMKMEGAATGRRRENKTFTVMDEDDDDDEEDEDFQPEGSQSSSSVAEEYDSEVASSSDDGESSSSDDQQKSKQPKEKPVKSSAPPKKKENVVKKETAVRKETKTKKKKDPNAPKKPLTAFMLYMNEQRPEIVAANPSFGLADVSKLGGERWRALTDKEKEKYAKMYNEARKKYDEEMKHYVAPESFAKPSSSAPKKSSGGGATSSKKVSSGSLSHGDAKIKSEEYVNSSDSSSD